MEPTDLPEPNDPQKPVWSNMYTYMVLGVVLVCTFATNKVKNAEQVPSNSVVASIVKAEVVMQLAKRQIEYDATKPMFFNTAGQIIGKQRKIFDDTVAVSSATSAAISYASAGFTQKPTITLSVEQNTSSAVAIPMVAIQTKTLTGCTVNIVTSNNAFPVLASLFPALIFAPSVSSMKLHIHAVGF